MENRIEVIRKCIDLEAEDMEYAKEDTAAYKAISNFLEYREIRTKQAWQAQMTRGETSPRIAMQRSELDRKRREVHNHALGGIAILNRLGTIYGVGPVYTGRMLTYEEIETHDSSKYDVRKEMTDWLFGVINEIYDYKIPMQDKEERQKNKFVEDLQSKMVDADDYYSVKEPIREDDGAVTFKDDGEFGRW